MATAAGPRRVGLTKNATPLLRSIGGRQHAQDRDHEEAQQQIKTPKESYEDIYAEPVSPDEADLRKPPPKPRVESRKSLKSGSESEDGLRKPPGSKRKRNPSLSPEPGLDLNVPGAGKKTQKTRSTAPRPPKRGQFEQTQAAKASFQGNKENRSGTQTPPTSSGNIWADRFGLYSSQTSQNGLKKTYGTNKTKNLHVAPASTKKQSRKPNVYGAKAKKECILPEPEESESECEMISTEELKRMNDDLAAIEADQRQMEELGLRSVPTRKKRPSLPNDNTDKVSAMDDAELDATLGTPTLQEHLGLTGTQPGSLPPSSAPHEETDPIDDTLPPEPEEGTTCPICAAPIDHTSSTTFWRTHPNTIKNQSLFCHSHRLATAQTTYLAAGYPALNNTPHIPWSLLPSRIAKHHSLLSSILANATPSTHRTRYTPLALTGAAASVPRSTRTDLPSSTRRALTLDLSATSAPGYYGPRGQRLMTESIMSLLSAEIKRCTDPVVLTSGPATFVQAVLVPEVAVRLIMEDLGCGVEEGEEVRGRTEEMGGLLFEEVEDWVEVGEEEEEEEEEGGGE